MRVATWALVAVAAFCALASAAPKSSPKPPKAPPPGKVVPPEVAEIRKLEPQLSAAQTKQAYLPASKLAKQILDLEIKAYGKDSNQAYYRRMTYASMLANLGDYTAARKAYQEDVDVAGRVHGPDSDEVVTSLSQLASTYMMQGDYASLVKIDERMIASAKKTHGENSEQYAQALQTYAGTLDQINQYSAAQRMYEDALKIYEAVYGPNDYRLMAPLQILAYEYWSSNQRPKATAMWDRLIKVAESSPMVSQNPTWLAGTIWGIASQYHFAGRDDLAAPYVKRAIGIYDAEIARLEKDKPDDYSLASDIGMVGYMLSQAGDLAGAEARFVKGMALEAKKGTFSAWASQLAEIKRIQGKPKEALALLEKANADLLKLVPNNKFGYSYQIAAVERELGNHKRAIELMQELLANTAKQYGRRHPMYGSYELQLAAAYMGAGDLAKAETALGESLDIAEHQLQNALKVGTDADHAAYFAKNGYMLDFAVDYNYYVAPKSASASRIALTTLLRRKGRALDASAAAMATIRAKLSPEDKQLLDDLATARNKLSKLTVAGPAAVGDPETYEKELAALEDQVQKLELQIGQKSSAYRAATQSIDLAPIQKQIPRDAKLVEIVNFEPSDPRKPYLMNTKHGARRYAAYVVGATGEPALVDLAPADEIDAAVEKFRKAVADPDNDRAGELGKQLYDLTIGKLTAQLGNSTEILIAPDGALNVVPFSALVDGKGDFLVKKYTFTYLTSGRDLLRIHVKNKAQGGGVIFAMPSFDSAAPAPKGAEPSGSRGRRSVDLASLSWPPLPGTGQEAAAVQRTMKGLKLFTGASATETAVKQLHSPRVLHLATHGFFLPDEEAPKAANDNDRSGAGGAGGAAMMGGPGPAAQAPANAGGENPLLRSGLAFAGANKLESGEDDGILTALEASGLDLEGTKLVVLSACETGVGKVTNGDGVYGLRRALVIAGAESLVMSLWQVDDAATRDLMSGYYKRLAKGESRSSALRDIQLELQKNDKYKHPYYWASFLPAGDNSPIEGVTK